MEKPNLNCAKAEEQDKTITVLVSDEDDSSVSGGKESVESLPVKPQERYRFIRSIGFGGMKGVLLVYDKDTRREVAMAIMPDFRDRPRRDLNRFVREAHITARLEHPNIVPVHDIGVDQHGSPFFTMKYLRGKSLSVILRKIRARDEQTIADFPQTRLLQILIRVCNAIAFAHDRGICHLDLKPSNIHCGDFGEVQVLDWGLAAAADDDLDTGLLNGTPGYMSPEFIRSGGKERPGMEADIYALGALLYAILTHDSPLAGFSRQEILRRTVQGRIPLPSVVAKHPLPAGLEAICRKAMSLNPADRYESAIDLRREIQTAISGFPTQAENAGFWRSALLFTRRHAAALIIVILLFMIFFLAALALYYYQAALEIGGKS